GRTDVDLGPPPRRWPVLTIRQRSPINISADEMRVERPALPTPHIGEEPGTAQRRRTPGQVSVGPMPIGDSGMRRLARSGIWPDSGISRDSSPSSATLPRRRGGYWTQRPDTAAT